MTLQRAHSREIQLESAGGTDVLEACGAAKELEDAGKYLDAAAALAPYWSGPGCEPADVGGPCERAHLHLRAGSITGWLGKVQGLAGYQEKAKDLLGRSVYLFEQDGDDEGAAEARTAMAVAYWREGAFSEAGAVLDAVTSNGAAVGRRAMLHALLAKALVARSAGRYVDAAEALRSAEPLLSPEDPPRTYCTFHNGRAASCHFLAVSTGLVDFLERAEHDYLAASGYAELVGGNDYFLGAVENNLCLVYLQQRKYDAAREHALRSIRLYEGVGNWKATASSYESLARVCAAEEDFAPPPTAPTRRPRRVA